MMQRYFIDNIDSRYIKNLLNNTPLPIEDTVTYGDMLIDGIIYIFKNYIIKCTKTGILNFPGSKELLCSENTICGNSVYVKEGFCDYDIISDFQFGYYNQAHTHIYHSNVSYYDEETHRYLGEYLRCLRGIFGIDLMPFYNCFNYRFFNNIIIGPDGQVQNSATQKYRVAAIPIKFNRKYTIALDTIGKTTIRAAILDKYGNVEINSGDDTVNDYWSSYFDNIILYKSNCSFSNPFLFELKMTDDRLYGLEKELYMLIQMPVHNSSPIVVLEGDYLKSNGRIIMGQGFGDSDKENNYIYTALNEELNKKLISKLSLLDVLNNGMQFAFSNSLIGYLLRHTITDRDAIAKDILRVQDALKLKSSKNNILGAWNNYIRYTAYDKYMNDENTNKNDVNGYIDAKMEDFLIKIGGRMNG